MWRHKTFFRVYVCVDGKNVFLVSVSVKKKCLCRQNISVSVTKKMFVSTRRKTDFVFLVCAGSSGYRARPAPARPAPSRTPPPQTGEFRFPILLVIRRLIFFRM